MNIDSVSFTSARTPARTLKKLDVPLKCGKHINLTAGDNYLGSVVIKGDNVLESSGMYAASGISSRSLWRSYEQIQKDVKEGFDFFNEFCNTILKKD